METSKKNSENVVVLTKEENKENDSGEKKTGFLDDDFELKNLREAQLDSLYHAISRYQLINSYKLAVLADGASDKKKST